MQPGATVAVLCQAGWLWCVAAAPARGGCMGQCRVGGEDAEGWEGWTRTCVCVCARARARVCARVRAAAAKEALLVCEGRVGGD